MNEDKLRTFEHFPATSICPICGKSDDKECFLIPITGTEDDGICEAQPTHTGCLDLVYDKENKIIYEKL